jgi:hypothetical protein
MMNLGQCQACCVGYGHLPDPNWKNNNNSWFFGLLCHVVWLFDTNIMEDHAATWCNNPENHKFYLHCHEDPQISQQQQQ